MTRRGNEVVEGVCLLLAFPVLVPRIALVLAAPDMGDSVDEAAIDERQTVRIEGGGDGHAVGSVAVEQARRGPVEPRIAVMDERYGNQFAVMRRSQQSAGDVMFWVMSRRDFLRLQKNALAAAHV